MIRIAWLLLCAAIAATAQSSDSQAVQALVQELRLLRQDLAGLTVAAQRVQLLLYRMQLQDEITKRSAQRHELVSGKLRDAERGLTEASNAVKFAEEKLASVQNPGERPQREEMVREFKRRVEMLSSEESGLRAAEMAAGSDLKLEQAKLAELQQRMDRLEQQLEKPTQAPAPKQ